jgi:hypothetical protein
VIPSIQIPCPGCGAMIEVPYVLLGAPRTCASCGQRATPKLPTGAVYPSTGFAITFLDFDQLVRATDRKHAVGRLLERWFGHQIQGVGDSVVVRSRRGESVDLVNLHLEIQKDSEKQRQLYGIAMALWR